MPRKQDRRQEVAPLAALAGVAAAMMEAARYTRGGLGTAGRRAGGAMGRRAWSNARDSGQRATIAFRVYRGEDLAPRVRPGRYVAIGAVGGMAAAYAAVALGRLIRRGPEAGPGSRQLRRGVDWARTNTARVVSRTRPRPVPVAEERIEGATAEAA